MFISFVGDPLANREQVRVVFEPESKVSTASSGISVEMSVILELLFEGNPHKGWT